MNLPFMLSLSSMAEAVTESNILPQEDGTRLVVMIVVPISERLDII